MIILIGGASHTGKTNFAQRLLERYKYPYLSIDYLKMGLIRSGNTELTPMSDDLELTKYLWPIVREVMKTAIENGQNLIIEGCYIPFDWQTDFDERVKVILELMISNSADAFEALPILRHADILRNILYAGVWTKYEMVRKKRTGEKDG